MSSSATPEQDIILFVLFQTSDSAIRYVSSLRSNGVDGCTVSLLYKSPTLELLHDALKPVNASHRKLAGVSVKGGSTGIYILLDSHEDGSEIISCIKLEMETLGISPRVTKQVYPSTSMQRAMLLRRLLQYYHA
ncbi:hypothetical protein DL95DRAFT_471971 [Leptodontidium sp. 2 PMI_412]|nr:hypothetical protein DL95DRAFT_471971 [Leptodontidium sp. 2 PMI_412]